MGVLGKAAFLLLILAFSAFAEDMVVINSVDGRDTLSGIFYANVKGLPVKFLPVPGGSVDVLAAKVGTGRSILLIQSKDSPASTFVEPSLSVNNTVEVLSSPDGSLTNLELAKRSGAQKFIIIDPSFSDAALSVLPYAAMSRSYVIFANKDNSKQVKEIVAGKKIMIYGFMASEVKSELSSENPVVVGDGSDKFQDNLAMAGKTMDEFGIERAYIIDGTFIEEGMAKGDLPILLTGKIVPQATYEFVKQKVKAGKMSGLMLVGSGLTFAMYDFRDKVLRDLLSDGINNTLGVTVRFAQAVPGTGGSVIGLDTFALPAYKPVLNISEIAYNKPSGKVIVSVKNLGEGPAYFTVEVRVKANGQDFKVLGDSQTRVVESGEVLGVEYPVDLSSIPEGSVTADALIKFGSTKASVEDFISASGPLTAITYVDNSDVSVQTAKYDPEKKSVLVTIRNNGKETAYVSSKVEVPLGGVPTAVSSSKTEMLETSSVLVQEFPVALSDSDLSSGKNATVYIEYGGRPGFLRNTASYSFALMGAGSNQIFLWIMAGVLVVLVAGAIALLMYKGSKKK